MANGQVEFCYQRRIIDDELDLFQPQLRALLLSGAKGVGKTATATQRANSILEFDEIRDRERYQADPEKSSFMGRCLNI
ncbi:MAG: hypothetical protein LBU38_07170 [Propionibacteriaceae bacterium]|jgi:Mg-chelatase subunit ChlI|nr:hypothetical protein [Propionibacteriaceae bacterium]